MWTLQAQCGRSSRSGCVSLSLLPCLDPPARLTSLCQRQTTHSPAAVAVAPAAAAAAVRPGACRPAPAARRCPAPRAAAWCWLAATSWARAAWWAPQTSGWRGRTARGPCAAARWRACCASAGQPWSAWRGRRHRWGRAGRTAAGSCLGCLLCQTGLHRYSRALDGWPFTAAGRPALGRAGCATPTPYRDPAAPRLPRAQALNILQTAVMRGNSLDLSQAAMQAPALS